MMTPEQRERKNAWMRDYNARKRTERIAEEGPPKAGPGSRGPYVRTPARAAAAREWSARHPSTRYGTPSAIPTLAEIEDFYACTVPGLTTTRIDPPRAPTPGDTDVLYVYEAAMWDAIPWEAKHAEYRMRLPEVRVAHLAEEARDAFRRAYRAILTGYGDRLNHPDTKRRRPTRVDIARALAGVDLPPLPKPLMNRVRERRMAPPLFLVRELDAARQARALRLRAIRTGWSWTRE